MKFCPPSVCTVNSLAAVSESRLSEPLSHSCDCGSLSPSVSVAVKGDAFDPKALTPLLEFRSSVAFADGGKVGEEGAT